MPEIPTRRVMLRLTAAAGVSLALRPTFAFPTAATLDSQRPHPPPPQVLLRVPAAAGVTLALRPTFALPTAATLDSKRPHPADRRFTSAAVEEYLAQTRRRIADAELAWLFNNFYPNTLDTTVQPGELEGKPERPPTPVG